MPAVEVEKVTVKRRQAGRQPFLPEQSVPEALSRLKAMRTGLSAGTLAVLIMWAPEPRPSPGSSSCEDRESHCHFTQCHPSNTQRPLEIRGKSLSMAFLFQRYS